MQIDGNTILITGGGSGIGRALAEALHTRGNRIIVAGRRTEPLAALCDGRDGLDWIELDVADPESIAAAAATLARDHPAMNVVVHNAGIMQAEDMTADSYDLTSAEATIATNLLGPIRLTAALLPQLKAQDHATIMTVSSGLASLPLVYTPTYCATKAAIHSWSQSLRTQLEPCGIDVIELVPPQVATDLMPGQAEDPNAMPLDAFIDEVMALIEANPTGPEILVEKVKLLRNAEAEGRYDKTFAMLNGNHRLAG